MRQWVLSLRCLACRPQVRELDGERLKAVESAVAARAEAAELSEARQRLLWQSKLLERLSEVRIDGRNRPTHP